MKQSVIPSPTRPPGITDVAIRILIQDLINRNQVPIFLDFAHQLGFKTAQQLRQFMQQKINFPKPKKDFAISVLIKNYNASADFLAAGTGDIYAGDPYQAPVVKLHQQPYQGLDFESLKRFQELLKINVELKQKLNQLQALLDEKNKQITQLTSSSK